MVAMGVHSLRSGLKQLTHNCSEGMMRNLSFFSLYRGGGKVYFILVLVKLARRGKSFHFHFPKGFHLILFLCICIVSYE